MPRETPGLSFREYEDMGCRAVPRGQLFLDQVRVPASHMVGPRGGAFRMILAHLDVIARQLLGRESAPGS